MLKKNDVKGSRQQRCSIKKQQEASSLKKLFRVVPHKMFQLGRPGEDLGNFLVGK